MTATAPLLMGQPTLSRASHKMRRRRLRSQLLGDMIVEEDSILEFPDGLFGFASCRHWVMVTAGRPGWCWLHAMDHPALAFLLADPFEAFPDFAVQLSAQDLAVLGVTSATEVGVFAIVTLARATGEPMTANLQGPVAIALPTRRGRQLVLSDARFSARAQLAIEFASDAQVPPEPSDTEA